MIFLDIKTDCVSNYCVFVCSGYLIYIIVDLLYWLNENNTHTH